MAGIGKQSRSRRKQEMISQKTLGAVTRNLVFKHESPGGETALDLTNLVQPTGVTKPNPSPSTIVSSKLSFNRDNFTLKSTLRPSMIDEIDYDFGSNSNIILKGPATSVGEIFEGKLKLERENGLRVVDTRIVKVTGSLAIGETDFNVGELFPWNKNPNFQIGAITIYRNGSIQARCVGNVLTGIGNYIEVRAGNTLFSSLIRFKNAAAGSDDGIIVEIEGTVDQPSESITNLLEKIHGDNLRLANAISDETGIPIDQLIGVDPTQIQLQQFGNDVLGLLNQGALAYQTVKHQSRAGFGSTATKIPHFTSQIFAESAGAGGLFSVTNDSTNGYQVTILKKCMFSMTFAAIYTSTGEIFGASRNATDVTANLSLQPQTDIIAIGDESGRGDQVTSVPYIALPGDVFRPHINQTVNLGDAGRWFVTSSATEIKENAFKDII